MAKKAETKKANAPEPSAATQHMVKGNGVNHDALRNVGARVIDIRTVKKNAAGELEVTKANGLTSSNAEPGMTTTVPEDPFGSLAMAGKVIEPPFDLLTLAMLQEHSTELNQCLEVLEINIDGTGHRFVSRLKIEESTPTEEKEGRPIKPDASGGGKPATQIGTTVLAPKLPKNEPSPKPSNLPPEMQALLDLQNEEKVKLTNFFEYATDESFTAFRRKLRKDLEATGNAYFEVMRNTDNEIMGFAHVPSYQMRLGRQDEDPILVDRKILELQVDGNVKIKVNKEWKRFRRFVQSKALHLSRLSVVGGDKLTWFKELGDPRHYDRHTGDLPKAGVEIPLNKRANEMVHLKIYSTRSAYGLPRYIGNLLSIFGDRAAEEINYITFRNNNIPSMILTVSNGQLTEATIKRIESFVESSIQGSDNYSKFLLIEAEPAEEEGEDGGQVKVEVTPLHNTQTQDSLFQEYSKNNQDKIRRAFRLPPILVGRADDYARATAESSRRIADEQVFSPERGEFDNLINRRLFPEMGILYHKYKSNSPNTTDNSQLVKILAGAEKTGGMTPRIARNMLEEILGIDLPDFPKTFPADVPFSLTMAEAVKNQADPTEPGQQVTALKALGILGDDGDMDFDVDLENSTNEQVLKKLVSLNKLASSLWAAQTAT